MKTYLSLILLIGTLAAGTITCKQVDCLAPPPSLTLAVSGVTSISNVVALTYTRDGDPRRINLGSGIATANGTAKLVLTVRAGEAILMASKADRQTFTLLLNEKPVGLLVLNTRTDDTPCNPWDKLVDLRFNGKPVTMDVAYEYPIEITP